MQVSGSAMPIIARRKDRDPLRRRYRPTVHIRAHRRGKHNARTVVILKRNGPLNRAGTQHRFASINAPKDLTWFAGGRFKEVIRDTLNRAINAMIERTHDSSARHQAHVGHRGKFSNRLRRPIERGFAANSHIFAQQSPAQGKIFICEDHVFAGATSSQGSHETRGSSANNQQIAMTKALVILIRVFLHRQRTKTCGTPNNRLVHFLPKGRRPHESLVIKTCGKKIRGSIVHSHHVKLH